MTLTLFITVRAHFHQRRTPSAAGTRAATGELPEGYRSQTGTAKPQLLFGEGKRLYCLTYLGQPD